LGGVLDVGFRRRKAKRLAVALAAPHENDAQIPPMQLDTFMFCQLTI